MVGRKDYSEANGWVQKKINNKKWYNITQKILVEHIYEVFFVIVFLDDVISYFKFNFISLYLSVICIIKRKIEGEVSKEIEKYINLEVANHIILQQIIATASHSIRFKKTINIG